MSKLIARRERYGSMDIWDNCRYRISIYADRAIYRHPCRKYADKSGNSWGLGFRSDRITGAGYSRIVSLLENERELFLALREME